MRLVNRPQARISIVIRIHAKAKRLIVPQRCRPPMVRVVAKAVHSLRQALLLQLGLPMSFALFLALAFLLQPATSFARQFAFIREWSERE